MCDMWQDVLDRTLVSFSIGWMTCPAIIATALLLAGSIRRRKRLRSGQCVQCGYDLRASSGVCPECGMNVEKHTQSNRRFEIHA